MSKTATVPIATPKVSTMRRALLAPFPEYYISWRLQRNIEAQNRGLALCYVDARAVQDRLDDVFGPDGWEEDYTSVNGGLLCALSVRWSDDKWTTKKSFGQAGGGRGPDVNKSSESDALKRAAVKYGIARYIYRIPAQWVDTRMRGKAAYIVTPPPLEVIAPWALPRSSDGQVTDVPYWEADEFAAHVAAHNATLPVQEPPEESSAPKATSKVAPGTGRDPAALIEQGKAKAAQAEAARGQAGAVESVFVLRDSDEHPVPEHWGAFYTRALTNQELGEYKAKRHIQNAIRQHYPGFERRAKAERQAVTIKQAWDVLRFRTLSEALQAQVLDPGAKEKAPAQEPPEQGTAKPGDENGAPAAQGVPWTEDKSEGGGLARYHAFLAKAHVTPAEAPGLLKVKQLSHYTGTLAEAVMAICDAKAIGYERTDKGLKVNYPPAD